MNQSAEWYLREHGGNVGRFWQAIDAGQRVGQAFFNALSKQDQEKVQKTEHDPFYQPGRIPDTINFLLAQKTGDQAQ